MPGTKGMDGKMLPARLCQKRDRGKRWGQEWTGCSELRAGSVRHPFTQDLVRVLKWGWCLKRDFPQDIFTSPFSQYHIVIVS